MHTRLVVALALAVLLAAPGVAAGAQAPAPATDGAAPSTAPGGSLDAAAGQAEADACEALAGGPQRENPDEDTLGWENGCWHDDPIAVTVEDGLNATELDAVVARTMARVEAVRDLEFEKTVPVEVISRAEFRERNAALYANASEESRLHQDVKHEALFFVPENQDALAQLQTNRGSGTLGYYTFAGERIVIISDNEDVLQLDGPTLVHELVHALQDQHFEQLPYSSRTTEGENANLGLVEGDPTLVEHLYDQRCGDEWTCPSRETDSNSPIGPDFDWGIYLMGFQPYSDGGAFVQDLRERGGWAAVNEAYTDPPASSEQVMYPEKYPDETPTDVTVADRSDDEWRILDLDRGVNYAVYGEAGMASMFISPTLDDNNDVFVSRTQLGTDDELDLLDYNLPSTDGWDGDKLYPYVTDDSAGTNETGYVWKTVWDSPGEAEEFAEGYVRMLRYRNANPVPGHADTYRIPDDEPYGDAFYVNVTGDTVVIVNAPTVDDLGGVRAGAAPAVATPTDSPTPTGSPTPTAGDGTTPTTGDGTPTTTDTPGFGLLVAAVAALLAALLLHRR